MFGKYEVDSVEELYFHVANDLLSDAPTYSPRGLETREIISPQIIIHNPRSRLVYCEGRKYNVVHAINEAIHLFSPSNKVEDISEFNKNMALFSDDGKTMNGSYGERIANYIPFIVKKLKDDPDSRQAVLQIYKSVDMVIETKDVPCTMTMQFLLRDDKLHMITNMRSNDILFGFQYDVFMFTMLQEAIANSLGVALGVYVHNPGSLHVYKEYPSFGGYEMLDLMRACSYEVEFANTSNIDEWYDLVNFHYAKLEQPVPELKGTVKELSDIVEIERARKRGDKRINYNNCYNNLPEWAKPFLQKWNRS